MKAIAVVVLALAASSLTGGCAGNKYHREVVRTSQRGCEPRVTESEVIDAEGNPDVAGLWGPVTSVTVRQPSAAEAWWGGSSSVPAGYESAPVGWSREYSGAGPGKFSGSRSEPARFPQPRDYFRPVVVQGRPGWRYEAPQRSRKGR